MDKETLSGNGGSEWTAIHVPFFCRKSFVYFPSLKVYLEVFLKMYWELVHLLE